MAHENGHGLDRRGFLRAGALATAAMVGGARTLHAAPAGPTVVIVRDKTKKVVDGQSVDAAITQSLVDKAVMTLAGKDDIAKAWAAYVTPKDKVAVKFNGLFAKSTTRPEVVAAVTSGLLKAGVDPANIVVYDRDDRAFATAGFKVNRDGDGPRAYPTGKDYGPEVQAGPIATRITNILHNATVLINVPMMKSHVLSGISGALKNHLGTVPNASAFHKDTCVHIGDLNALEPIKAKTRICICDALSANYHKGPQFSAQGRWDYYGILAAIDPLAMDATLADLIKGKRVQEGLPPYLKPLRHIERAAELGVGVADLAKINRVELEI